MASKRKIHCHSAQKLPKEKSANWVIEKVNYLWTLFDFEWKSEKLSVDRNYKDKSEMAINGSKPTVQTWDSNILLRKLELKIG